MAYNESLKSLQITEAEVQSVDAYRGISYTLINSLLELGVDNEKEINSKLQFLPYDKESVKNALDIITTSYSAMVKNTYKKNSSRLNLYRGTTQEEMARITKSKSIGRFLSTTNSKEMAEGFFSLNWDNPAVVTVYTEGKVPFIDMAEVIEDYGDNWEKEILLAPFTKVESVKNTSRYDGKEYYNLNISKQDLPELDEKDRKSLYNEIIDNSDKMGKKLKQYFKINNEVEDLSVKEENFIKKMGSTGLSLADRKDISENLNYLRDKKSELVNELSGYEAEISDWKSKIINYCKGECREVEKSVERNVIKEQEEVVRLAEKERLDRANNVLAELKNSCIAQIQETLDISVSMHHRIDSIRENQDKYEKEANTYGLKYNRWCKCDKDKEAIEELRNKLNETKKKIEEYTSTITDVDKEYSTKKIELDKLLSSSKEINFLLNQVKVNNLNGTQQKELNGLKKSIMNKFVEIKAKTDTKKLEMVEEKIDKKSGLRKFVDRLTGQKKVDEYQKEQIKKQKHSISTTLNNLEAMSSVDDEKKYSVHEIMSKMDKYILENKDNAALKDNINEVTALRQNILQMFRVDEQHIKALHEKDKSNQLLPVDNKKIDKITKIKLETDRWIKENEYDIEDKRNIRSELNKSEDTTYHDVSKITKYIDQSLDSKLRGREDLKKTDYTKEECR